MITVERLDAGLSGIYLISLRPPRRSVHRVRPPPPKPLSRKAARALVEVVLRHPHPVDVLGWVAAADDYESIRSRDTNATPYTPCMMLSMVAQRLIPRPNARMEIAVELYGWEPCTNAAVSHRYLCPACG